MTTQFHILFIPSCKEKIYDADDMYTKGEFVCFQMPDGRIIRHPLIHVWEVSSIHGKHLSSQRNPIFEPHVSDFFVNEIAANYKEEVRPVYCFCCQKPLISYIDAFDEKRCRGCNNKVSFCTT